MNPMRRKNRSRKQCLEVLQTFFANTSIRGFSRIVKSESTFLRFLWILFVISTITFLIVSIFKVVIDYRQYSVNIQTYLQIDNATPFPALTFCNHQPFSENAYQLWEDSKVMSPTLFNELFRLAALKQFQEMLKKRMDPRLQDFHNPLFLTTMNDRISIYYQNLPSNITSKLGHNISMIKNCIWSYGQHMAFDNHCEDHMLIVKKISHPSYFNCFTVEPHPNSASIISKLGLIIWLGPDEQTNIKHTQGFLLDIFEQAYGLRVVIHEPGSYPNIESQGVQIEPGRLNELNYQPELNINVDTERKPCFNNPQIKYKDFENEYSYDINLCFNMELQRRLIEECKCIYSYYPRYLYPNKSLPYCGFLDPNEYQNFLERKQCIEKVFIQAPSIKNGLKLDKKCITRCSSIEYSTTTSVTKWRPTDWQLYWLKEVLGAWVMFAGSYNEMMDAFESNDKSNSTNDKPFLFSNITNRIETFFKRKNLSESIPEKEKLTFNERYTFVVVKRKANNTFIKEERLVLSFNALVSRVGGLCSLYIGLNFAFFIELIDFLYTIIFLRKSFPSASKQNTEKGINCQTVFLNNPNEIDDISPTKVINNSIEFENNGLYQGPNYWTISSKGAVEENAKMSEEENHLPSHSFLHLSNPWIPIDDAE